MRRRKKVKGEAYQRRRDHKYISNVVGIAGNNAIFQLNDDLGILHCLEPMRHGHCRAFGEYPRHNSLHRTVFIVTHIARRLIQYDDATAGLFIT